MPYGFNDDKSRFDLNEIVPVTDEVTFTPSAGCRAVNESTCQREGGLCMFTAAVQTAASTLASKEVKIGTLSVEPAAPARGVAGNEAGSFSMVRIDVQGNVYLRQSTAGSQWHNVNMTFAV